MDFFVLKNKNFYMGKKNSRSNSFNTDTIELVAKDVQKSYHNIEYGKKNEIKCQNEEQKEFIRIIDQNEITLCNGPAGCGKTHLSIQKAIKYIQKTDNQYNKIYIITPNVEVTRSLGHLPGGLSDKISVYVNSIYRLFDKIIGEKTRHKMIEEGVIETLCLGYIRGENFDQCLVIVDESQNVTKKEMLTILTRIGKNCKMILSGDIMQIDKLNSKEESGLYHAMENLKDVNNIGVFEFSENSVVRNKIITDILKNY